MSIFLGTICIFIVLALNCPAFKGLQINADQNATPDDDSNRLRKINDHLEDQLKNKEHDKSMMQRVKGARDLSALLMADLVQLVEDLADQADCRHSISIEAHRSDSTSYSRIEILDQDSTPNKGFSGIIRGALIFIPISNSTWTRRLRGPLSALSILQPVFLILGVISAIRNGIYVVNKFRTEIIPRGRKVWMDIVQEISFTASFDYLIDFCPLETNN